MPPAERSPALQQLAALADDPRAQADHAAGIVAAAANATGTSNAGASGSGVSGSKAGKASRASATGASSAGRYGKDVLAAALAVLAEHPAPQARPDLLRLLAYYGENKGVRDQGGYLRRALLEALRPVAVRDDAALVAQAAATYEFWPPDFAEDAVMLRGAAIVVLAEIDEELARYYAARLLVDPYLQPMSGEPAVSAARVLGALDELRVLWSYVFGDAAGPRSEVVAECLRQLVGLPAGLLPALVERFGAKAPAAVQLGLVSLLINHHAGPQQRDYLRRLLAETRDADIYRYLVMSMVAAGHDVLIEDLLDGAPAVQDRQRLETLVEALELLGHRPRCAQMAQTLKARLASVPRSDAPRSGAPRSGRSPVSRQP